MKPGNQVITRICFKGSPDIVIVGQWRSLKT